jgi:hypothetical protein
MSARWLYLSITLLAAMLVSGCATKPAAYDYTEFQRAKPATLLVLPPLSDAPDIKATPAVWSHATRPLAESGYYVMPVTLVDETFRQNGVMTAHDAQDIPHAKLRDFFGADAAMYLKITKYGTSYQVVASETVVAIEGRLVDLRTGALLWQGAASASSAEQRQQNQGGLVGMLVTALVQQIVGTATDAAYGYAGTASSRLMTPRYNGILPGPRSPNFGRPPAAS